MHLDPRLGAKALAQHRRVRRPDLDQVQLGFRIRRQQPHGDRPVERPAFDDYARSADLLADKTGRDLEPLLIIRAVDSPEVAGEIHIRLRH
jgi:hypothetical protein